MEFRVDRQRVLTGDRPTPYHAVISESALRVLVGSEKIMRKQLLRLIELARLPHVTVQVFPFRAGAYSAYCGPFVPFQGSAPGLDTVYFDRPVDSAFTGDGDRVRKYAGLFEQLASSALAPVDPEAPPESHESQDSLGLIQHIMYDL